MAHSAGTGLFRGFSGTPDACHQALWPKTRFLTVLIFFGLLFLYHTVICVLWFLCGMAIFFAMMYDYSSFTL